MVRIGFLGAGWFGPVGGWSPGSMLCGPLPVTVAVPSWGSGSGSASARSAARKARIATGGVLLLNAAVNSVRRAVLIASRSAGLWSVR